MISIIIPVYKSEATIGRCLDSIMKQTYEDWEALVVDDGAPDNSGSICDEYGKKDQRIKVFHQANGGVSKARNVGLAHAQGEWVTFADSDDYLEPDAFEAYMDAATKYEAEIVRGGYFREYEDGRQEIITLSTDMVFTDTCPFFCTMERKELYSFLWTLFVKKSSIGNLQFNEHLTWLEDHIFSYATYLNAKKMVVVGKPLYHYIIHKTGSLSDIKDPFVVKEAAEIELNLKTQLIHGQDEVMQNWVENLYRFRLTAIVGLLYKNKSTYKIRRWFADNSKTILNLKYKEEKVFFSKWIPFFLRDGLLRVLFTLKRKR